MINRILSYGLILAHLIVATGPMAGAAMAPGEIPPELASWQSWVLHGQAEALCPTEYNNGWKFRQRAAPLSSAG